MFVDHQGGIGNYCAFGGNQRAGFAPCPNFLLDSGDGGMEDRGTYESTILYACDEHKWYSCSGTAGIDGGPSWVPMPTADEIQSIMNRLADAGY